MNEQIDLDALFERRLLLPDPDARERLAGLVGIEEYKSRLAKILGILLNPSGLEAWADKHHPEANGLIGRVLRRPPLVVLAGDVGTGKTELAETIGDMTARQEGVEITLFPMSLATRGSGRVGEMTRLISAAFDHAFSAAKQLQSTIGKAARGGIILLIDEADALAQSRENAQMHHEDRAGVNSLVRGIDRLAASHLPAAVIMCTNRLTAVDPAIRRRAADLLHFRRPDAEQRSTVLQRPLLELRFSPQQIAQIVGATGARNGCSYGCTFSDLTQRYIPSLILDAYPERPISFEQALRIAEDIVPTPPFNEQSP